MVRLGISRLYLRLFDIEWDPSTHAPRSVAGLVLAEGQRLPDGLDWVPVVFVEQEVLGHLSATDVPSFARALWTEVKSREASLGIRATQLQLDCDWTDRSREVFFAIARQIRRRAHAAGAVLSATLRLHQVKYRERTGVPPVDRAMLMFYNMGTIDAEPESRAIFDPHRAQSYLGRIAEYPLPLDAALPIWSWVVHGRDGQVEGLIEDLDPDELSALDFLRADAFGRYEATRSAFLHGRLLREGDVLKPEVTGPAETLRAAKMLAPLLPDRRGSGTIRYVSLFDLSEKNIRRHGMAPLEQVFRAFR